MDKINFLEDEFEDLKKSIFNNSSSGAIGKNASTTTGGAAGDDALSMSGFSGGQNARATVDGAVQLGQGTNNDANTLQFHSYKLLDEDGKIPNDRLNLDAIPTDYSTNPITSGGIFSLINHSSVNYATLNTTYYSSSDGGEVYYIKIGNLVFVHIENITFKNTRQEHNVVLISNLPTALMTHTFCMTCWGGTITTLRVRISSNSTTINNYWSAFTPTTSQKWSASFFYICK